MLVELQIKQYKPSNIKNKIKPLPKNINMKNRAGLCRKITVEYYNIWAINFQQWLKIYCLCILQEFVRSVCKCNKYCE